MVYNLEIALKREFSQRELKGKQEGEQEGFNKAQKEIAKKLFQMGIEIGKIAEATSLSEADIESTLSEIEH